VPGIAQRWQSVDAIDAFLDYLKVRLEPREGKHGKVLFINQRGKPVSKRNVYMYWLKHLKRVGLARLPEPRGRPKSNRYGKNPHELRDLFRTRWGMSEAKDWAAEFFMGHKVDPLEYNKAMRNVDYARSQYLKAEPWLNVLSHDEEKASLRVREANRDRLEEKIRDQEAMIRDLQRIMELVLANIKADEV